MSALNSLRLIGYFRLNDIGFARPIFAAHSCANCFYVGMADTPGSARAKIQKFIALEQGAEKPEILPCDLMRDCAISDLWPEIFLWAEQIFVGDIADLNARLVEFFSLIAEGAPISFYKLRTPVVTEEESARLAQKTSQWLAQNFGEDTGRHWLQRTRPGAVWISPLEIDAERARKLVKTSIELGKRGERAAALEAAKEAVDIFQKIAAKRPTAYDWDLAASLDNLGDALGVMQLNEQALDKTLQAVDIFRKLAAENPTTYNEILAIILTNLGGRFRRMKRYEEALSVTQEAVDINRKLVPQNPMLYKDLARSLSNLAGSLISIGQVKEAVGAAAEAVDIFRNLATLNPDLHNFDLAYSLYMLGNSLAAVGHAEEALKATTEAVDILRKFAVENPGDHNAFLFGFLNNLGSRLEEIGRCDESLAATSEAVDICRRLAIEDPIDYVPRLALSLTTLAKIHSALGHREEALACATEAPKIITPCFLASSKEYQREASEIAKDYQEICGDLKQTPDTKLLDPIREEFALLGEILE